MRLHSIVASVAAKSARDPEAENDGAAEDAAGRRGSCEAADRGSKFNAD
jgi:hypothetical protein